MRLITLYLPEIYIRALDELVPKHYPNRSEIIRTAVRDLLIEELWSKQGYPTNTGNKLESE